MKGTVDKAGLLAYVNKKENGLVQEVASGKNNYKMVYRPADLLLEQELHANPDCNKDSLKATYSDCRYFVLSLQHDSLEIFGRLYDNYDELLKRISFGMRDYVTLIENKSGTVFYLSDFVYPRMYNTTQNTSILLCFKDAALKNSGDYTLQVKDFLIEDPQADVLKFSFSKNNIDHIPTLKL